MADTRSRPDADSRQATRQSLLSQLRNWEDQAGWQEFFDTYWRLIYNVARESGLTDAEAQDVVQNTFIYLARRMPGFRYDRSSGSFKSWLRAVTRSRLHVFWRTQKGSRELLREPFSGDASAEVEAMADPSADALDQVWQREWEDNLLNTAMRRVRARVSSRHLLIFRLSTSGEASAAQVARKLGVNLPQVYLARHRVGRLIQAEVQRLRTEME